MIAMSNTANIQNVSLSSGFYNIVTKLENGDEPSRSEIKFALNLLHDFAVASQFLVEKKEFDEMGPAGEFLRAALREFKLWE